MTESRPDCDQLSICHVLNAVDETSTEAEWATRQAALDSVSSVTVLTLFQADSFSGADAVAVECLGVPGDGFRLSREQFRRLVDAVDRHDVVHTHHNHCGFYAKLAAAWAGTPVIVTEHNDHASFTLKGRVATALTNPLAEEVVCVSESVRDSLAWWERLFLATTDCSVVPNGVNLDRIEAARSLDWSVRGSVAIDPNATLVGSAGMLTEQKAHDVLIEAVDRANRASDRPIELVISGDGERRADLQRQIDDARHGDRMHLLGFLERRDQVYKLLHEIDVYAMPSRWEGFCVAALEAMAAGNPCVFSEIPAFAGPFEEHARFHPVDDPDALADELLALAAVESDRNALAAGASALVRDRYSIRSTVEAYLERYHRALGDD